MGEILNLSFFLFPFAIGAFAAAAVPGRAPARPAAFPSPSRREPSPRAADRQRHQRTPAQLRTGTAALVGRTAVVLEPIDNDEGVGAA